MINITQTPVGKAIFTAPVMYKLFFQNPDFILSALVLR
jgi:hypothetical protein